MPRNSRPRLLHALAVLALALTGGGPTARAQDGAGDARERLRAVERALDETGAEAQAAAEAATALRAEVAALTRSLVDLAAQAQERETLVASLTRQLETLRADQAARRAALAARRAELTASLGALARLARMPDEAYFLYPGDPLEAVRGAVLLRAAAPSLAAEADGLARELAAIERVERDIAQSLATLKAQEASLADERARIEDLSARKRDLLRGAEAERAALGERQRALGEEAADLRALMARLTQPIPPAPPAPGQRDADRRAPPADAAPPAPDRPDAIRAFPAAAGLTAPARGRLALRYGQETGTGQASRGIRIETGTLAQVVAPFDGKVMFAGPFREFGRVLILEHADGYHSLLAGLGGIAVDVGQWVLAGEPVGQMGEAGPERPRLYVELRKDGRPVNPLNWIAAASIGTEG